MTLPPQQLFRVSFLYLEDGVARSWIYDAFSFTQELAIVEACRRHALRGRCFEVVSAVSIVQQKKVVTA